ncbi:PTS sugar transporter subunit IIB [Faecalitalea cylindroides]|uniref:PTS sugar transporter subunit IIB n=1 Tax=Faecalitalea cylindroides TaxID=39483 RepID=UPI00189AAB58|nr:PTS sugar transporter subunit IIB [Faecalitalea cylindroides]MDB7947343.1 PTS sugar transporter subunit IIB [Faecalitalea cylindroides]MDB7949383.1 PTS sugar transporter subunit IIB [Faecalitalea cylindroides]MDB7951086.1 PTS sugar transporter subunit IIB [Faecalitalea cylindroides]
MKKIVLLCNQGMSTSALVAKMREVIERNNLDYQVNAYSVDSAETEAKDADVILLGPQIRYKKNEVKNLFPDKPVETIDMSIYGMLDGKKVVIMARKLMGDK